MNDDEVERLSFGGWPFEDAYLVELGRVSALWATLESLLNLCIGKLAGFNDLNDPTSFILVTHASFPQRLDMLGALCEQRTATHPRLKGCPAVLAKLRSAQQTRNRFVHHGMSLNPESGEMEMGEGTARGRLKTKVSRVRIADIRRAAMAIHLAELELYELIFGRRRVPVWQQRRE